MRHAAATELPPPRGAYGSPRLIAELRERGEVVSRKTVAKVIASIGVKTTVVELAASFSPDLVDWCFDQDRLDAVWPTDNRLPVQW